MTTPNELTSHDSHGLTVMIKNQKYTSQATLQMFLLPPASSPQTPTGCRYAVLGLSMMLLQSQQPAATTSALVVVPHNSISRQRRHHIRGHSSSRSTVSSTMLLSSLFDDDGDDDDHLRSRKSKDDGETMAKEFYRQLRDRQGRGQALREIQEKRGSSNDRDNDENQRNTNQPLSEDQARRSNETPFSRRKVMSVSTFDNKLDRDNDDDDSSSNTKKIKYTGRQAPLSSSDNISRFFGTSDALVGPPTGNRNTGNLNGNANGRQRIIEQEFNLVGLASSGRAIGFQAGLVALTLVFYIYVGLSGGIQSYDNSGSNYSGTSEDEIFPFEQVMPVPTDRESSVWL